MVSRDGKKYWHKVAMTGFGSPSFVSNRAGLYERYGIEQ
jgi:hypothetical protein